MDDLDEGSDPVKGYRSLIIGAVPVAKGFEDQQSESTWVADEIERLLAEGARSQDICVVGRTARQYRGVKEVLAARGLDTYVVSRDTAENTELPGVRLANMHRIKGLEFRIMFIVGVSKGVVPLEWSLSGTADPVEKRARDLNERALLHVAGTRAINGLYVTWAGEASEFLQHWRV